MLKKLVKLGLIVGLSVASLSAETFQKGDTVIVKAGNMLCYAKESSSAIGGLVRIDLQLEMFALLAQNAAEKKKQFNSSFPKTDIKKASFCAIYGSDHPQKFYEYAENGKYALLDSKDYWLATYASTLKKGVNKPQSNAPTYSFLGIDDLEAFPSDYVGKLTYLKCKRSTPTEDTKNGGYTLMSSCAKANGKYGFGGNNPFKIEIHINNKDTARSIAKSKNQEKWFLGTVKKNTAQFALTKNIFEINEVQFK